MDDDEWGDVPLSQESVGASEISEGGTRTRVKKKGKPGGKAKAKGKAKSKAKASKAEPKAKGARFSKQCFCARCTDNKLPNSKFCRSCHRHSENIKYQATQEKPSKIPEYNISMRDPSTAQVAIDDFARDNPVGTSRNALIDWVQYPNKYGSRSSTTVRQGEVLMGIADYWVLRGMPYGKTRLGSDR